jgi:predicted DCC family thiol-disulfide oxidoreductase YuxK
MPGPSRSAVVYDAGCGPCTTFKRVLTFLDPKRRIDFISLADADNEGILDGLPESRRWSSFHLVAPGGAVQSGARALPEVARLLPSGSVASRLMTGSPGGPRLMGWLYCTLSRLHNDCAR